MLGADPRIPLVVPPTPWIVAGRALVVIGHLGRADARQLAGRPRGFAAPPLAGSVAVLGLVDYSDTPVGPYYELAVSPGVLWRDLPGALVSHMFVDSARSRLAGRALWGLPKELARFFWEPERVAVSDPTDRPLLTVTWEEYGAWPRLGIPPLPVMTLRGPRRQLFTVGGWASGIRRARVRLTIPPASPLAPLAALTRGPYLALWLDHLRLRISDAFDML
jgi:hypothetical protein